MDRERRTHGLNTGQADVAAADFSTVSAEVLQHNKTSEWTGHEYTYHELQHQ